MILCSQRTRNGNHYEQSEVRTGYDLRSCSALRIHWGSVHFPYVGCSQKVHACVSQYYNAMARLGTALMHLVRRILHLFSQSRRDVTQIARHCCTPDGIASFVDYIDTHPSAGGASAHTSNNIESFRIAVASPLCIYFCPKTYTGRTSPRWWVAHTLAACSSQWWS